jgi:hypothetical protein
MEAKIDSLADLIRPHVQADPNKFFSNQNFEDNIENDITVVGTPGGNNIPGIKSFIIDRRNFLASQIATCMVGTDEDSQNNTLDVYPNPANDNIHFYLDDADMFYEISNLLGTTIQHGDLINGQNTINISSFTEGIYLIRIKNKEDNILLTQKITKLKLN